MPENLGSAHSIYIIQLTKIGKEKTAPRSVIQRSLINSNLGLMHSKRVSACYWFGESSNWELRTAQISFNQHLGNGFLRENLMACLAFCAASQTSSQSHTQTIQTVTNPSATPYPSVPWTTNPGHHSNVHFVFYPKESHLCLLSVSSFKPSSLCPFFLMARCGWRLCLRCLMS